MTRSSRSPLPAGIPALIIGLNPGLLRGGALGTAVLGGTLLVVSGCLGVRERDLGEVRRRVDAERIRARAEGEAEGRAEEQAASEETPGAARADGGRAEATASPDIFREDAAGLDLHDVLSYALEHSPRVEAARYRYLAAEARERASGWLQDPRLSWTHGFEEIQTRNGPVRDVFSLTQTFPYWGKLTNEREAASERASAEREALLAAELEVLRDVQRAYFGIYLTSREIEINRRTSGILERFVRVAQQKVAAGKGGQPDILLAEIELSRLENERIDLDQRLFTERALLNTLLDRAPGEHLPPVSEPRPEYRADVDELIAWMLESLPDLRRHRHLVEENRAHLRLARLRYVPDVTLGVNYTSVGESPVAAGAIDNGRDAIAGMVGIDLPVWIPKYSAEVRAAERALDATRASLANAELVSVYRVMEMHVRVETALRQVELLRTEILPKARQTLNVLETAYEAGSLDFLKLLDAERALERFELEHERARTEFERRLADLERAVGKPLREETSVRKETRG